MSEFTSTLFNSHWVNPQYLKFNKQVHIYSNRVSVLNNPSVFNVLNVVCQPQALRMSNREIICRQGQFNLILTHDQNLLNSCSNAKKMLFGTSWIHPQNYGGKDKKDSVSFLCGGKNSTNNHIIRRNLWDRQHEIKFNKQFYSSSQNPYNIHLSSFVLGGQPRQKIQMFKSKFHIAIQNTCIDNYFSQKLIDCLITKTIPIYIGPPNIGQVFDKRGIITANSIQHIISICNSLDGNTYDRMKQSVQKNYQLAQQYAQDFSIRLAKEIRKYV